MAGSSRSQDALRPSTVAHQMCVCGHSDAAHLKPGSACTFCDCTRFRFDRLEEALEQRHGDEPGRILRPAERYIPLTQVAEALGVNSRTLKRSAERLGLALVNIGRRWAIEASHIRALEREYHTRSTPQEAQRAAFEDSEALLSGHGRSVSEPSSGAQRHADPARRAEAAAMEHILNPDGTEHRLIPARRPRKHQAARIAERRALDDILKPRPPEPPERSI